MCECGGKRRDRIRVVGEVCIRSHSRMLTFPSRTPGVPHRGGKFPTAVFGGRDVFGPRAFSIQNADLPGWCGSRPGQLMPAQVQPASLSV